MLSFDVADEFCVERVVAHGFFVAEDDEFHAGSCHRHVHASEVGEEAYLTLFVGADEADEDDVALLALEAVDGVDGDGVAQGTECVGLADELAEVACLHFVGGDDADVESLVEEALEAYLGYVVLEGGEDEGGFGFVDASVVFAYVGLAVVGQVGWGKGFCACGGCLLVCVGLGGCLLVCVGLGGCGCLLGLFVAVDP